MLWPVTYTGVDPFVRPVQALEEIVLASSAIVTCNMSRHFSQHFGVRSNHTQQLSMGSKAWKQDVMPPLGNVLEVCRVVLIAMAMTAVKQDFSHYFAKERGLCILVTISGWSSENCHTIQMCQDSIEAIYTGFRSGCRLSPLPLMREIN